MVGARQPLGPRSAGACLPRLRDAHRSRAMRKRGRFLKTCCCVFRTLSTAGARSGRRFAKQANRKRPCSPLRARPNLRRIRWTTRDWARRCRRSTARARPSSLFDERSRPRPILPKRERRLERACDRRANCNRPASSLNEPLTLRPSDGRAWFALGLVCEDLRDTPGAIQAYRRSIEAQPDIPEAHVNLGLNLQNAGDLDAAMDSYRRAMRLRPDTFGRIAQALTSAKKGRLWLNSARLRRLLEA